MRRILILIEEYNEMVFIETFLRKIGFDVVGIQKASKLEGELLSFNPNILFISGKSKQIPAVEICKDILKKHGESSPNIIYLYSGKPTESMMELDGLVSAFIESPVDPGKLIHIISVIGEMDEEKLINKYQKMVSARESQVAKEASEKDVNIIHHKEDKEGIQHLKGQSEGQAPLTEREKSYKEFLSHQAPVDTHKTLPPETMRQFQKELAAQKFEDDPDEEVRLEETEKFLKALFKK